MREIIKKHMTGDLLFTPGGPSTLSNAVSGAVKAGQLRKLTAKIYTSDLDSPMEEVCRRNAWRMAALLFPGAVVSHRSAAEGKVLENHVFLTWKRDRKIRVGEFVFSAKKGASAQEGDTPFVSGLYLSSPARCWLENLSSKGKEAVARTMTRSQLEEMLGAYIRHYGEDRLRDGLSKAHKLAPKLSLNREYGKLEKIISALLGSGDQKVLKNKSSLALIRGTPFDTKRMDLFEKLFAALKKLPSIDKRLEVEMSPHHKINLAFYDAYFSNYIEGTKFIHEEAEKIVFEGKIPERRPDGHDIVGTYRILLRLLTTGDPAWKSPEDFIYSIKTAHGEVMAAHPDKRPGEFKLRNNRAGDRVFVDKDLVEGTLKEAFPFYVALESGLQRAFYAKFLLSEVHPFEDGNGRISRMILARDLNKAGLTSCLIPTVYRLDYVGALKKATTTGDFSVFVRMLLKALHFTASIDFGIPLPEVRKALETHRAFSEEPEDVLKFHFEN